MSRSFGETSLTGLPPMRKRAGGDILQPGYHPQCGGLSAAGRAHQNHELALAHIQVQILNGMEAVRIHFIDLLQAHRGHCDSLLAVTTFF